MKINKLIFEFIWGSNYERVSKNELCNNIESGGAKMMRLESYLTALHAKSLSLLFDETYCSQWKFIENLFFDRNLLSAILLSNIKNQLENNLAITTFKITNCVIYCTFKILQ